MAVYYLQDWDSRDKIFEVSTGSSEFASKRKVPRERLKISGYAVKHRNDFLAVYADNDRVFFKVNSNEWDFSSFDTELQYSRVLFLEFVKIRVQGKTVFSKWYNVFGILRAAVKDPTFDKIDEDSSYFLQWCYRILNNSERRKTIAREWREWNAEKMVP